MAKTDLSYFALLAVLQNDGITARIVAFIGDVNAQRALALRPWERVMQRRPFSSFGPDPKSLYADKAAALRELAELLCESPERDELLREAERCDRDARVASYLNSNDLKPPT